MVIGMQHSRSVARVDGSFRFISFSLPRIRKMSAPSCLFVAVFGVFGLVF